MTAAVLDRGRLGWLSGLAVAAMASHAMMDAMSLRWVPRPHFEGPPQQMFALLLGLSLELLLWQVVMKMASESLAQAVSGREDIDERAGESQGLRQALLWLALMAGGVAAWIAGGGGLLLLYGLATLLVLPTVLARLVFEDSLRSAMDPRAWLRLPAQVGAPYLLCVGQLGLLLLACLGLAWMCRALPPVLQGFSMHLVDGVALVWGYHAIGRMLADHQQTLSLPEAHETAGPVADAASAVEALALREAARLAEKDAAAAAARLSPLIRGQGASAAVHARYRQWLQAAGDADGLQEHARGYIAVLLALGQERQALSLFLSARAQDAAFELAEPQELGQLIVFTERQGQSQLALELAEQYLHRFPRTRDCVAHGLRSARLLQASGRSDAARARLRDLLARHPDHALAAEMTQALDALQGS